MQSFTFATALAATLFTATHANPLTSEWNAKLLEAGASSCSNAPLSCHGGSQASCCYSYPSGQFLLVQFWDTNPPTGPSNSWTIHGLWPDFCNGQYTSYCDPHRAYTNITQILQSYNKNSLLAYMNQYWQSNSGPANAFWAHEWDKHGTCMNTLKPSCFANYTATVEAVYFFERVVALFKTLPSYTFLANAGITPTTQKQYSKTAFKAALTKGHGAAPVLQCDSNGAVYEVYYTFNLKGGVANGQFVPAAPKGEADTCGNTISYVPKN